MSFDGWVVYVLFQLAPVVAVVGTCAWLLASRRRRNAKDWLREFPHT